MKKIGITNDTSTLLNYLWILVFIVIFIKSNVVLFSLYSINKFTILLYSMHNIMAILFLISFSFLFSGRKQLLYLFFTNLSLSILFIVDIVYARAYGHLISFYMIFAKGILGGMSDSILSIIKWTDFLILIDLPFFFLIAFKSYNKNKFKKRKLLFLFSIVSSVLIICFQFIQLENAKALGNNRLLPLIMSPIGNHMYDLYRFIYEKGYTLSNDDIRLIDKWFKDNEKYQSYSKEYEYLKGIAKGKNIIAIHYESLENIVINQSYYDQEITPNINRLLNNSIYFNNLHEQIKDGNSSDAEFMFNTSMYPLSNGSTFLRFGENKYTSLPIILKKYGYNSIAVHGDDKEFWNRNIAFPAIGFNRYIAEDEFERKDMSGIGIIDENLFYQSMIQLEKINNPFYLLIMTITPHMPFDIPKNLQYLNLPNDDYTCGYLQSIHYTDKVFGDFYKNLESNGYLENSILIIYGDHEGIHKYYDTNLPDNNTKVPFIIHIPGMNGVVMDKIGGQVDIMPTLSYLLGFDLDEYAYGVMGRNLFSSYPGTVLKPTGEILGEATNEGHLVEAQNIADLIIKGNYFNIK